jgi:intracellular multiplication protein IcmJ
MKLLPIILTARRGNWQRFLARRLNERFLAIQTKLFARDEYTCRYCNFQSEKYQVIVNHDHDYSNNKSSNLVTACMFCAQCFFLDQIGKNNKTGGYIIYLPEIEQADLNHICRILFTSLLRDAPYKGKLQNTYLSLKDRTTVVDDIFGPNSSEPNVFGQALIDSNFSKKQLQHPALANLRLLPEKKFFAEEIVYWKATVFDQIPL